MARIFITGSAGGLGRAAALTLLSGGHEVIVHARTAERLAAINDLIDRGGSAVVGDLSDLNQTRAVADQVNQLGRVDAVIHNAGIYSGPQILPVNVVAPYLLTALIHRPQRLVYLSSGMHHGGRADVAGVTGADNARPARTRTANCSSPPSPSLSPASGPMCTATPSTPAGCPPEWAGPALPTTSGSGT
jgi:NAD(P)-dependent dehydrogenase (short-subunit alcohol dehydrogenase family)